MSLDHYLYRVWTLWDLRTNRQTNKQTVLNVLPTPTDMMWTMIKLYVRTIYLVIVFALKALELLRCLYASHWKQLSVEMNHSVAVQHWVTVWVRPVLELVTSGSTSSSLRSRLSDVILSMLLSITFLSDVILSMLLFIWISASVLTPTVVHGSLASWKVMEFKKGIFQAWNITENDCGHGKVMEIFRQKVWDGTGELGPVGTGLVFCVYLFR